MGKTAFVLSVCEMNKNKDIRYINIEMDGSELSELISFFPNSDTAFDHVEFVEMEDQGADIIDPDGLNIIDYLDPPEGEYFKMTSLIHDIHAKLEKGIAIICIQKMPDKLHAGNPW